MTVTKMSPFLHNLAREMAVEGLPDQQLVEAALADGGEPVFGAIVRRHGPMVYRVCWRVVRHEQDAEDAFQATFLILARKLRSVRNRASLASWLHGVAHRVALQSKNRASARRRRERRAATPAIASPDDVNDGELWDVLDAELVRLPERWRLPLVLCYLQGRTQDEAAALLGWSKGTLRNRLNEARDALGRRLKRLGVVWSSALFVALLSDCAAHAAPALVAVTVRASARIAGGQPAGVSTAIIALTRGALNAMILTRVKSATAVLVVLSVLAFGAGIVPRETGAVAPADRSAKAPTQTVDPAPGADLTKIGRTIRKEPAYRDTPRYCLLVLGRNAETRIWLVIDGSTLYADLNGNGDLTEESERIAGKHQAPDFVEFRTGPFTEADRKTEHPELIVYQYFARQFGQTVNTVAVMNVRGARGQTTNGEDGCMFADSAKDAPIIHMNGPLTMRAYTVWVEYDRGSGKKLKSVSESGGLIDFRDESNKGGEVPYMLKTGERVAQLHAQVGTPGLGKGTFAALAVEQGFPADLHPVVGITTPDKADPSKVIETEVVLSKRCCGTQFYGPVKLPGAVGGGNSKLTLSFPVWKEGQVLSAVAELPMVGPMSGKGPGRE